MTIRMCEHFNFDVHLNFSIRRNSFHCTTTLFNHHNPGKQERFETTCKKRHPQVPCKQSFNFFLAVGGNQTRYVVQCNKRREIDLTSGKIISRNCNFLFSQKRKTTWISSIKIPCNGRYLLNHTKLKLYVHHVFFYKKVKIVGIKSSSCNFLYVLKEMKNNGSNFFFGTAKCRQEKNDTKN